MNIEWQRRYRNDLLDRFMNDTMFRLYIAAAVIIPLILILGIYKIVTYREYVPVTVQSIGWDTSYLVYQYQTNHKSDWSIPSNGRQTDSYMRKSGTRRVIDHYAPVKHTVSGKCEYVGTGKARQKVCISDKTFYVDEPVYRDEPIYRRYYEYDIDEWNRIQSLTTQGIDHNWYMPITDDYVWYTAGMPSIGDKRLGMPSTHFYAVFVNRATGKIYTADMVESMWRGYSTEDSAKLTLNYIGMILKVEKVNNW